jgi:pimeloyl-ACP methyl ester carboxylesterase
MGGLAPAALNAQLVGDAALHIPGEPVAQLRQAGRPRCGYGDRGRLLDAERVASYPTAADAQAYYDEWIAFYLGFYVFEPLPVVRIDYGFDTYKVTYCSIDARLPGQKRAEPTIATGNLSIPRKHGKLPTVLYLHGTAVSFYDAPSNPNIFGDLAPNGESFEGPVSSAVFAGAGFVYVAPDYPGFGDSAVPRHRYFHADTEASSTVDLLVAARTVLRRLKVATKDDVFTFGFSQGGHAALAVQRELEKAASPVAAAAAVGGVFDVERFFLSSLADETTVTLPLYVSFILLSYDDIYDVYMRPSHVFRAQYAATVPGLFDMQHYWDDVLAGLPPTSRALLRAGYFDHVRNNPDDPLRVRLRQNAVDRWRPRAPIFVFHSRVDEEVFFADAMVSIDRLRNRGADVTVTTFDQFDHVNTWIHAMPLAVTDFRTRVD